MKPPSHSDLPVLVVPPPTWRRTPFPGSLQQHNSHLLSLQIFSHRVLFYFSLERLGDLPYLSRSLHLLSSFFVVCCLTSCWGSGGPETIFGREHFPAIRWIPCVGTVPLKRGHVFGDTWPISHELGSRGKFFLFSPNSCVHSLCDLGHVAHQLSRH